MSSKCLISPAGFDGDTGGFDGVTNGGADSSGAGGGEDGEDSSFSGLSVAAVGVADDAAEIKNSDVFHPTTFQSLFSKFC